MPVKTLPTDPATRATPAWLYACILAGAVAAAVFPGEIVAYVLIGPLLILFLWYFAVEPEWMLPIFILAVPLIPMLPAGLIPVPGLNFQSFFILALLAGAIKAHLAENPPLNPNEFRAPVAFFVILLVLSAVYSVVAGVAQGHSWQLGWYQLRPGYVFAGLKNIVFYLFLAPIAFRLVKSPSLMRASVQMIAVVTMVVAVESLWSFSAASAAAASGKLGTAVRAEGLLFNEPNALGGFLALMCGIFLALTLAHRLGLRERVFYAVATVTAGAALLYTFSRGSWLGLLAGLVVFAFIRGARAWALIAVLVLTATIWLPESAIERVSMTVRDRGGFQTDETELEGSTRSRLDRWIELPGQWIQAPLLGHGFMAYGKVWGRVGKSGEARGPHSTIIKLAVEQGLVGLAAYAWLLWVLYRNAREVRRRGEDPLLQGLATGFIVALATLVLLDASGNRFLHGPTMAFIWIIGGGLARAARQLPATKPRQPFKNSVTARATRSTSSRGNSG